MQMTGTPDTLVSRVDASKIRLDLDVYDPIAREKGYTTVVAQADWHDIHRSTMQELRAQRGLPRLDTAMQIAADCGCTVEELFGGKSVAAKAAA